MTCFVYGYGQASFDPAAPSTDDQEAFVREACATLTRDGRLPTDASWKDFIRDEATRKPVTFRERHAGSLLLARLGPNHVVIVQAHDRIFTTVADACETLELAKQIGFRLLILDYGLDTGAPQELVVPLAEMMNSLRARERGRTKEEFEYRKRQGMPAGGKAPIGWKIVRANLDGTDSGYFVPDHCARRAAEFIVAHYDRWGGTFEQTAYWLNAQKIFRPDGRRWRKSAVYNWYRAAKAGFPLPNGRRDASPIPVNAAPSKHCRSIIADDD